MFLRFVRDQIWWRSLKVYQTIRRVYESDSEDERWYVYLIVFLCMQIWWKISFSFLLQRLLRQMTKCKGVSIFPRIQKEDISVEDLGFKSPSKENLDFVINLLNVHIVLGVFFLFFFFARAELYYLYTSVCCNLYWTNNHYWNNYFNSKIIILIVGIISIVIVMLQPLVK